MGVFFKMDNLEKVMRKYEEMGAGDYPQICPPASKTVFYSEL